jgi:hypothetical protein
MDFVNLTRACPIFASTLTSPDSAVWKEMFLSRYDFPNIDDTTDFIHAYQLRNTVLRQFVPFVNPKDKRLLPEMETIRDMVLGKSPCHIAQCLHEPRLRIVQKLTTRRGAGSLHLWCRRISQQWLLQMKIPGSACSYHAFFSLVEVNNMANLINYSMCSSLFSLTSYSLHCPKSRT